MARQCGRLKATVCFAYHGSESNSVNQGKILLESVASIFFQSYVPTERFSTSNISSAIGGITSTVRPPQTFMLSTNSSTMKTTKVKNTPFGFLTSGYHAHGALPIKPCEGALKTLPDVKESNLQLPEFKILTFRLQSNATCRYNVLCQKTHRINV